ncbi:unnamed protein product [Ectocarpus sp. 6 AP-2014]
MVSRRYRRLAVATASFAASLAASNNRCCCCDAFLSAPRSSSARAAPGRPASSETQQRRGLPLSPARCPSAAAQTVATMSSEDDENSSGDSSSLDVENVVIIGSGPAGYTASIYAGRANLKPLCFEGLNVGPPGGQLMTTTDVDNFPGFPAGVTGPDLMNGMRDQALRWGGVFKTEDVEEVDFSSRPFVVRSTSRTVKAQTVIIATGATAKRLRLPSEDDFWSRGISACAICDGAAPIFADVPLGVVGGGDSAVEEAVYLTKYSPKVHLFVRKTTLVASRAMVDRLAEETSVEVHLGTIVEDVQGETEGTSPDGGSPLTGVRVRNTSSDESTEVPLRGLFYAIGHRPNTGLLGGQIELDEQGYIKVKAGTPETNVEGVFAAGDVQDREWRQAITAAGSGCTAALAAERYLATKGVLREVHQERQKSRPKPVKDPEEKPVVENLKTFEIEETRHRGAYAYQRLYFESDRPLLVKYISPTCGPCKALGRLLERVVDEMADDIHFVEVDITESPDIAQNAGITGTPTVQIFRDKTMLDTLKGVKPRNVYRSRLKAAMLEQEA